jgi:quercetin dioxygenase-like cupin family protein
MGKQGEGEGVAGRGFAMAADSRERACVAAGEATESQVLIGSTDGAPHFTMRRFIMGRGGGMPLHTNSVEHEQYVLCGSARIRIGDEEFEVHRDHIVFIPAGVPHSYSVIDAPFEFLCIVPNAPDRIELMNDAL